MGGFKNRGAHYHNRHHEGISSGLCYGDLRKGVELEKEVWGGLNALFTTVAFALLGANT